MEIVYFDSIDSTQKRLIADIKGGRVQAPVAYFTNHQTAGVGSRENRWIGARGNFFLSFAYSDFPADLPQASVAIYVSFLLKEVLARHGSRVWIKWPNDFYLDDRKIGGCVTNKINETYICGIGLNTTFSPRGFGRLDISIQDSVLLEEYFALLESRPSWKEIFSKYALEFHKNKKFTAHVGTKVISLQDATLAEDGALILDGERIYSLR